MQIEDEDIYQTMQGCPEKGLRMVMDKFSEQLYWHIRRLVVVHDDAQDALQNTLVNVFKSFQSLKKASALRPWIFRIATHEAINVIKKRKCPTTQIDEISSKDIDIAAEAYVDYTDVEAIKLQKAILSLPPKQQTTFNLRYYDEMEYSEIAQVTATSLSTAKVNYHLAKEKIIKYMNSND